jgi:mRNA interferase MazF
MPRGELTYRRGEIWWVELDPAMGVESKKTRACLILQNNAGNKQGLITTVVPFLESKNYPFVVNVQPTPLNNLNRARGLHLNQIRSVDYSRVKSRLGIIEDEYFAAIKKAVDLQLGF